MANGNLQKAAELLRRHYGEQASPGPSRAWTTLVKVVLSHGRVAGKRASDWTWLNDSPLASPQETAACHAETLVESLKSAGHAERNATILHGLARWLIRRAGADGEFGIAWDASLDVLRGELRQIRGVNAELADRILLFVGGRATFPLNRAALRIACRHGWMDLTADYDEWQSFFVRGLEGEAQDVLQLSSAFSRVGKDYCGPRPACDECPLKPLLPERGPVEVNDD